MMASEVAKTVVDDGSHRFLCPVEDCRASFRRKEHLTRHSKTHNPEASHTCSVCLRKFNRSDSLHRHLARHGENFKTPSSRSKSACLTCHAAKIKCDGEKDCQNCLKKGIECKYRSNDVDPIPQLDERVGQLEVGDSSSNTNGSSPETNGTPSSQSSTSTSSFPIPRSESHIDWASVRIQSDSDSIAEPFSTPNLHLYFTHFHHRFPIIHRPSYITETKGQYLGMLKASMEMIGAWFEGSVKSRDSAIESHQELMKQCFLEISNISSNDVFQDSLPAGLCQAILLNVIFVLYSGKTSLVSRALILHNILITALREVDFFNPHTIWADEKPGVFLPYHLLKMGERQKYCEVTHYLWTRLTCKSIAETLFKLDVYLSIARGNAPILTAEELVFQAPSSFSLWNSNGLHTWEERLGKQPIFRMERTMYDMINSTTDFTDMIKSHLLWEDIQLCLSSIQAKLWRLHTIVRNSALEAPTDTLLCKEILKKQFSHLKIQIDQMALCPGLAPHYYGFEDHTSPEAQPIVEARSETLRFDTIFLYHLLNIHLYSDISGIRQMANEFSMDLSKYSEEQQHTIGGRRCDKAAGISTPDFRRALCHAVDILSEFQLLETKPPTQKIGLDPIAYVAISTATLILWVHLSFGVYACTTCAVGLGFEFPETALELGPSAQSPCVKEEWVQHGLMLKVTIDGMNLCACNFLSLIEKFKAFIPHGGWELSESIAPGVFGCSGVVLKNPHTEVAI